MRDKEFEKISKKFNTYYDNPQNTDKVLIVLIGKKLPREYKNLKNIDFDKNTTSSLEDLPIIEALVETFQNLRFILLNIDDFNISVKIR